MFGRSSITLEWGQEFSGQNAAMARRSVEQSKQLAGDVLRSMGVVLHGHKTLRVLGQYEDNEDEGSTSSSTSMVLYSLTVGYQTGAEVPALIMHNDALIIGHELLHAERMRYHTRWNCLEEAVTEGISYSGEDAMMLHEPSLRDVHNRVAAMRQIKPEQVERMGARLLSLGCMEVSAPGSWLNRSYDFGLRKVDVLGVNLVQRQLGSGATFDDLLKLPPEEFIDDHETAA